MLNVASYWSTKIAVRLVGCEVFNSGSGSISVAMNCRENGLTVFEIAFDVNVTCSSLNGNLRHIDCEV